MARRRRERMRDAFRFGCGYTWFAAMLSLTVAVLPFVALAMVVGGLAAFALGLDGASVDDAPQVSAGLAVAVSGMVVVALAAVLRQRPTMASVRAGAWPGCCRGDRAPRTKAEFEDAVRGFALRGKKFDVVGGGWTSWMNRRGAARPRLFTHNFAGYDEEQGLWRVGSTIEQMADHYYALDFAFPTYPTQETISLGAWIACENHGNSGDLCPPSHEPFSSVYLLNRKTLEYKIFQLDQQDSLPHPVPAARKFLQLNFDEWVLMYAGIDEGRLVPRDVKLQYSLVLVKDPNTAAKWLETGAMHRYLFFGSARKYGMGIRVVPRGPEWRDNAKHRAFPLCCVETEHVEPHCCSIEARYFQSDPCSYVCGWHESPQRWDGYVSRWYANRWYPRWGMPTVTLGGLLLGIRNFEIIFYPPTQYMDGRFLWKVASAMRDLFQKHRGRCEFRYGGQGSPAFLDCGIPTRWTGKQIFGEPFRILWEAGVEQVATHTGKWRPPDEYLSGVTSEGKPFRMSRVLMWGLKNKAAEGSLEYV